MESNQLKKRIVGAIVLVALGVIFIPMLLTGNGDNGPIWGSNIPDKPKAIEKLADQPMPDMPAAPPPPEVTRNLIDQPATTPPVPEPVKAADDPSTTETNKPEQTGAAATVKSDSTDRAWAVQVGSFSQQANAISLRDKLRKKNYPAFVESIKSKQATSYRVRVGPYVRRADADAQLAGINKEFKVKAVVLAHP